MSKKTLATIWLDGCSGCHMSFLDMDERLIELADKVQLVYSPLVDNKDYPERVDIALIEGAVSNVDDLVKIKKVREHTTILVALGDCAVNGNVPSMRNLFGKEASLDRGYIENAQLNQMIPNEVIPALLDVVRPVHEVVKVDCFVQGCPPSADAIYYTLCELLEGRMPKTTEKTRFGS